MRNAEESGNMNKEYIEINKKFLSKILHSFNFFIIDMISQVLDDSEEDPHYSAVFTRNYIIWYIAIKNDINEYLPFSDVKGYFEHNGYAEEYELFEKKRLIESEYFEGEQY